MPLGTLVRNQIGEWACKNDSSMLSKRETVHESSEQWKDGTMGGQEKGRLEAREIRERMGFRAWRAEPRHGQFVTRSGTMMEDGDILTPMEQPPQCLLYYLSAKDEVILLAPDHKTVLYCR